MGTIDDVMKGVADQGSRDAKDQKIKELEAEVEKLTNIQFQQESKGLCIPEFHARYKILEAEVERLKKSISNHFQVGECGHAHPVPKGGKCLWCSDKELRQELKEQKLITQHTQEHRDKMGEKSRELVVELKLAGEVLKGFVNYPCNSNMIRCTGCGPCDSDRFLSRPLMKEVMK